jgi:asparagine synthase (glutamine-hydrolysing)
MCGICAIIGQVRPGDDTAMQRMLAALAHRGPDSNGTLRLSCGVFGHSRLSIIDLASGGQPMRDMTGRYAITFNGEIYNYAELRDELVKLGRRFETHSDTEVILNAFAEWGEDCLDRFRGMFAFAIWDEQERQLFAARDLFGEKPLYFARADGRLLVASEIKAFIASGLVQPVLSLDSVDAYLALGYVPPDRTIYSNVSTLPPGHCLWWDGVAARVRAYWRPRLDPRPIVLAEAAERLNGLLKQAVRRQMVADVPVGAFLSGGHDSSTIVALMQMQVSYPIKTFSVGFGEYINELPYARAVADLYRTEHHEIDLGMPPVPALLERMAEVYDEPFRDPSHVPTYLISEYARRYVKVVLSGDGADELFGGYAWYPLMAASNEVSPNWLKWVILRSASRLLGNRLRTLDRRSHALGLALRESSSWTRYFKEVTVSAATRRSWWGGRGPDAGSYFPGEYYRPPASTGEMDEVFHLDLVSFLPGDILVKVDRAAMANSLETRAPFLDRDLVEFALSLPSSLKVKDNETKIVFKQACAQYWPRELWRRGKQGFAAPFQSWFAYPEVAALVGRVFARGSHLRELLPGLPSDQHKQRSYETWTLLALGLWLERHGVDHISPVGEPVGKVQATPSLSRRSAV